MAMSASALARHRTRQWAALQPVLACTPALAGYAGGSLSDFPIVAADEVRADYGCWNSLSLSDSQLRAMADAAAPGALSLGWSTGSSGGTRGLFVANLAERADYLGQSLARLMPARALLRPQRLALHLRANSALYSDVRSRRFAFAHLPLEVPIAETAAAIEAFAPTILIAPPYRLLERAESGAALPTLRHLFYGSEPMSEAECAHVEARIGIAPRPIFQATEGFLGGACRFGRLHLNDHAIEIELEPVAGTPGFRPIVTDLRRRSQPIVRVRGDDYLELDEADCRCGYAGRVIAPVAGRVADIWRFKGITLPPSAIVKAVEGALGVQRWQALADPQRVKLRTAPDGPVEAQTRAAEALSALVGQGVPVTVAADLPPWPGPKRRKVVWADG